jgi:hypothetical protein
MLVHTPRYMGPPQWSDLGMWLQTVMLLLLCEEGLDRCPQDHGRSLAPRCANMRVFPKITSSSAAWQSGGETWMRQ